MALWFLYLRMRAGVCSSLFVCVGVWAFAEACMHVIVFDVES